LGISGGREGWNEVRLEWCNDGRLEDWNDGMVEWWKIKSQTREMDIPFF